MPDLALLLPASQLFPSLHHACVAAAATNTTCSKAAKWNLGRMMQGTDDVRKERGREATKEPFSPFVVASAAAVAILAFCRYNGAGGGHFAARTDSGAPPSARRA